jgi:molecular chaperone DnaK
MDAAYIAGLDAMCLVNDALAASLYYVHRSVPPVSGGRPADSRVRNLLVVKLGAGDYATSLIRSSPEALITMATESRSLLGGQDFDERLVEWVRDRVLKEQRVQLAKDRGTVSLLRQKCETAKQTLSTNERATIRLDFRGRSIPIEVTRDHFREATSDLRNAIQKGIERTIENAQLDWGDIERVLLVGGGTRMPLVSSLINSMAGPHFPIGALPDDAVVLGCALFAQMELRKREGKTPAIQVCDVSTHDLGVRVNHRHTRRPANSVLIPRNTALPASCKSTFSTTREGKDSATIRIVQSRDAANEPFEAVGKCTIDGVDPSLPVGSRVSVEFQILESGRLSIHAESPSTGRMATKEISYAAGLSNVELNQWRQWVNTMMLCSGLFE